MINILFVSAYLARNGTEAFMMNVFRKIDKKRYHVDFLIGSRKNIAYEDEIISAGSNIYVLPSRKTGLKHYVALDEFYKKNRNKYDVIHICKCSCSTFWGLWCAYKYKIPVRIVHSHNSFCVGLHTKILHYLFRPINNILLTHRLACSEKASKWLFGEKDSLIIKNGIDVERFSYNVIVREEYRKKLHINDSTKVIGHVGRFETVKNHDRLIEIFLEYNKVNPNSLLLLIGVGDLLDTIKQKVEQKGISQFVLFLGLRNDVPELMQVMDCFVMPSIFEGLPFVLVEAQAAGLPCIVSDNIDKQTCIIPSFKVKSLESANEEWVREIQKSLSSQRCKTDSYIQDAGFSISCTVKQLNSIYNASDMDTIINNV